MSLMDMLPKNLDGVGLREACQCWGRGEGLQEACCSSAPV